MKVYFVVGSDYDGSYIDDHVFLDKDIAEQRAKNKNIFKGMWDNNATYKVVEKETSSDPMPDINKDMLAIKIDGNIVLDDTQELPEISAVVAEDWCISNCDVLEDFISVTIFIKTKEDDFYLDKKELIDKYKYVWDDILNTVNELKDKETIDKIALIIENKYAINW